MENKVVPAGGNGPHISRQSSTCWAIGPAAFLKLHGHIYNHNKDPYAFIPICYGDKKYTVDDISTVYLDSLK